MNTNDIHYYHNKFSRHALSRKAQPHDNVLENVKFLGILKSLWKIEKVLEVSKVRGNSSEVQFYQGRVPGSFLRMSWNFPMVQTVIFLKLGVLHTFCQGQYIVFHKTIRDLSPSGVARCWHRVRSWYCIAKASSVTDTNARNYCTGAQKKVAPDRIFISTVHWACPSMDFFAFNIVTMHSILHYNCCNKVLIFYALHRSSNKLATWKLILTFVKKILSTETLNSRGLYLLRYHIKVSDGQLT